MRTIAVLIPAYNEEAVITDALECVASQERRAEQIIVVDDGSQDSTVAKVEAWSRKTGVVVDLVRKTNGGLPSARNAGFRRAWTDCVAFLDADDLWYPNHLAVLERGLTLAADTVLCFGITAAVDPKGRVQNYFPGTRIDEAWEPGGDECWIARRSEIYSSLLPGSYIGVSSTLISRAAAEKIGFMDENLLMIEDCDFWMRLSRTGNFVHVPTLVCTKRVHDRNMTNPRNALQLNQWEFRVLQKMLAHRVSMKLSDEEVLSTIAALRRQITPLFYSASKKGVRAYSNAWIEVTQSGIFCSDIFNPRHLLRAGWNTLAKDVHSPKQIRGLKADNS